MIFFKKCSNQKNKCSLKTKGKQSTERKPYTGTHFFKTLKQSLGYFEFEFWITFYTLYVLVCESGDFLFKS